jgi:hypothetical protein
MALLKTLKLTIAIMTLAFNPFHTEKSECEGAPQPVLVAPNFTLGATPHRRRQLMPAALSVRTKHHAKIHGIVKGVTPLTRRRQNPQNPG